MTIEQIIPCTQKIEARVVWEDGRDESEEPREVVGFALTSLDSGATVVFPLVFDDVSGCILLRPHENRFIRYKLGG